MSQDIDSWLIAVAALCENKVPDKMWENPLPDNAEDFEDQYYQSFKTFVEYSTSLSTDLVVEVNILKYNPYFEERAKSILRNINKLSFSNTSELWLLSYALSKNPTLLSRIEINENNYVIIIWCLAQCVDSDINYVLSFFHEKLFDNPPVSNQVNCHAFLLLLHFLLTKLDISDDDQPPFSTDEFEVIFCLAFCSKRSRAKALAASIVPLMANFISQTNASHLLFRRMLPYCAMVNRDGQKMALAVIESIVSNYERFLSCMSTWISLHPFCVAASNNLLIDMKRRGLITNQMKTLIKHIRAMNKRLKKGQIKMTKELRMALPRSLWTVKFPPPLAEVNICDDTCKKISKSIESKRSLLIPVFVLFFTLYILYVLV